MINAEYTGTQWIEEIQKREVSVSGTKSMALLQSKKAMIRGSNVKSKISEGELFK